MAVFFEAYWALENHFGIKDGCMEMSLGDATWSATVVSLIACALVYAFIYDRLVDIPLGRGEGGRVCLRILSTPIPEM